MRIESATGRDLADALVDPQPTPQLVEHPRPTQVAGIDRLHRPASRPGGSQGWVLIGGFTPSYVLEEYPEFETWEGLQGNEHDFDTPETSGDSGQFLAADPSFTQRDEHIVENLGLDLEVIQSGSEAAQLTEVESAIDNEEPIRFYFYTPHWAFNQWDLSEVELPEPTDECLELPEEERDCGYPDDVLAKVVNADLEEKSSTAYQFIDNFHMENEEHWQEWLP